jgi:hypothetical protein
MDWKDWNGKHIFVKLKTGGVYTGEVIEVDDTGGGLIFIVLKDKFGKLVSFVTTEIVKIVEEE